MIWKSLLFSILGLFTANAAQADILFIDLNLSSVEVAAARAAAEQRGEKLVVIPDLSPERRREVTNLQSPIRIKYAQLEALHAAEDAIFKRILHGKSRWDATPEETLRAKNASAEIHKQIQKQNDELSSLYGHFNELLKQHGFANIDVKAAVNQVLSQYQKDHKSFSSIVLSSHHVGDGFFGLVGSRLSRDDVVGELNKYPQIRDQISSLYLWGCYTNTIDELKHWKTALPKLAVIAGFDKSAPSEDKAVDGDFLKELLVKEKTATAQMDEKKLVDLFKSIPNINAANAALYCGDYYVTNHGSQNVAFVQCKPEEVSQIKAQAAALQKYLKAEAAGYQDVPENPQTSTLRALYTRVRQMSHCPELKALSAESGRMVRLIFFKNIMKNFAVYFKWDIFQLNTIMKSTKLPGASFPDLLDPKLTRAEVLKKLKAFTAYWDQAPEAILFLPQIKKLEMAARAILNDVSCVGSFWIEYPQDVERLHNDFDPNCADKSGENP